MSTRQLLCQMFLYYLCTIGIETPVLILLLSPSHSLKRKLAAGAWLTACTYPIVFLVLPQVLNSYALYVTVAEVFAPVAEYALFALAYHRAGVEPPLTKAERRRDLLAVALANLASFGAGMFFQAMNWM